jgi:hypothetical protein
MVVGFATTCAINAYHHSCCEFESRSGRGVQHYVIKFVSDLRQVVAFLWGVRLTSRIKLTATMTEILLKVALNAIKQTTTISMNRGFNCFRLLTLLNPVVNSFWVGFMVMVLNTTFNNFSAISWWSVLLLEYPEKTTDLTNLIT